jgi:hypothetical protein
VKIGDLIKFKTGYTGIILRFCDFTDAASVWITEDVDFMNPTFIGIKTMYETAEVISENR